MLAERVRSRTERLQIEHRASRDIVTLNIGVAAARPCSDLISCADQALYYTKQCGRHLIALRPECDQA